MYIYKRLPTEDLNHCKSWGNLLFFIAELCSFPQLPITPPCGLTLERTAIRTARHRSASRGTRRCDNCVRILSSYLPHKPVKIRCFFDADSPAPNYTRHLCSTAPDAEHISKLITRDRVLGTEAKQKYAACRIWLPTTRAGQNPFKTD